MKKKFLTFSALLAAVGGSVYLNNKLTKKVDLSEEDKKIRTKLVGFCMEQGKSLKSCEKVVDANFEALKKTEFAK